MCLDKVRVYISTIKKIDMCFPKGYEIVQAGSENNKPINNYLKDNTLENISYKNKSYCELTVLYWIWKNRNYDINGLTHHRRFFFNRKIFPQILNIDEIETALTTKEIIVPKPIFVERSVEWQYKEVHVDQDYDLCREVIKRDFGEFLDAFNFSSKQNYLYPYNMLITRKNILDDYCSFLFPILEKLEQLIDISERNGYQQRVFGFLAERLFQTWLIKNDSLDLIEFPVYNIENSIIKQKVKELVR